MHARCVEPKHGWNLARKTRAEQELLTDDNRRRDDSREEERFSGRRWLGPELMRRAMEAAENFGSAREATMRQTLRPCGAILCPAAPSFPALPLSCASSPPRVTAGRKEGIRRLSCKDDPERRSHHRVKYQNGVAIYACCNLLLFVDLSYTSIYPPPTTTTTPPHLPVGFTKQDLVDSKRFLFLSVFSLHNICSVASILLLLCVHVTSLQVQGTVVFTPPYIRCCGQATSSTSWLHLHFIP